MSSLSKQNLTMLLMIVLFCACVSTVTSQTIDQGLYDLEGSGDSSGSASGTPVPDGSGDGSGVISGSGELERVCVKPFFRPPPPNNIDIEVVTVIRCHLACIEKVSMQLAL